MKRIYKIMRDKKGEGYIDAAVVVFCVMFVIALGVRIFGLSTLFQTNFFRLFFRYCTGV